MSAGREAGEELFEGLVEGWTAAEAQVIHEFCQRLSDRLWERYEEVLIEHLLGLDGTSEPPQPSDPASGYTLPLPFIELEPPF